MTIDDEDGFDSFSLLDTPLEAAAPAAAAAKFRPKPRGPKKPPPATSSSAAAPTSGATSLTLSEAQPSSSAPSTDKPPTHDAPDDAPGGLGGQQRVAKLQPRIQTKPSEKAVATVSHQIQDTDNQTGQTGEDHDDDPCEKSGDQGSILLSDTRDVNATVSVDSFGELINAPTDGVHCIFGDMSTEPTVKFHPMVGPKNGSGKSVSFAPSAASEIAEHSSCVEFTDRESQCHDKVPSDQAGEEMQKSTVGEIGSSVKLRSREKLKKVGAYEHMADDSFGEDCIESLVDEQDNDSGDEYTTQGKQRTRKRPRKKGSSEEPSTGKNTTKASSRNRQKKDACTEQPEKKLTHRIRQKRMKEVQTLLETPKEQIDHKKLSAMHLRLLQEARERIKGKEIQSQPPSSNQSSSQLGEYEDDFDLSGDAEPENGDNGRQNSNVLQNATKLNYHSYMAKQTRAKWSKSDTELFYEGLQQFGTDFAMIKQLFPDKTRDQIRQKFKSEERKNPMQVHDAVIQRSRDNSYFKKVLKELNIEDVQLGASGTHKTEGAPSNEDGSTNAEEDDSNWSDNEHDVHSTGVKEVDLVSENGDDDLDSGFDWV
ncbi:hypothetical protein ACP70R_031976 [Stipagrostis hirtigluma subsp. patula]